MSFEKCCCTAYLPNQAGSLPDHLHVGCVPDLAGCLQQLIDVTNV